MARQVNSIGVRYHRARQNHYSHQRQTYLGKIPAMVIIYLADVKLYGAEDC